MNIGRVHTHLIFIARGIAHSTWGTGAYDEYWKGVHLSNIHRKGYRPLDGGYRGMQ